jgi:hypothetical protein
VFEDGEEQVPVTDADLHGPKQTLIVRVYGDDFVVRLEELAR